MNVAFQNCANPRLSGPSANRPKTSQTKISLESVREAVALLERALALDPCYAPAAGVAMYRVGQSVIRPRQAF